ncbi:cryptochrome DASH, chloroplastic/mitochondrial [Silene latifolia]|uniref:cryptochrome DASH, chloroplastic/mitochondrial n=1 Tax=Silene latifolia TaxID=37657 RepID=UPI003D7813DD
MYMYTLRSSSFQFLLFLQKLAHPSKPTSFLSNPTQNNMMNNSMMTSTSKSVPIQVRNMSTNSVVYNVPSVTDPNEMDDIAGKTFQRYSLSSAVSTKVKRDGKGVCIVWFRNDLRVLDNEALFMAWNSSQTVLPVYCLDPRLFGTTHSFGFPKAGGLRAKFLIECLMDLRKNLRKHGLDLLIRHGKPEEILPVIATTFGAHTIYAQTETCSEEVNIEIRVQKGLHKLLDQSTAQNGAKATKLKLVWDSTLYHLDDLPFDAHDLPDVYTQFRKSVESKCKIRGCIKIPASLGPPPEIEDWGAIPSVDQLGLHYEKADRGLVIIGGESASLCRVHEYFWKKDLVKTYKETRNGMLGADYSTKFSPWLATGSLSPRFIYEEVKRYESERVANDSTYWVLFELIWRDYFRFLSIKCGNSIFHLGGPRKLDYKWSQDSTLFESWKAGKTGYPLVDANMKELAATGFMSNRGRQIVCSFLVRDMGIDWRMGAEWFESCLLDYDPCSNYGNWTYGAGVGNDPREDRYFSIPKQAKVYDPEGEYVTYWLPELKRLPKDKRHFPGFAYLKPIVPLKYGNTYKQGSQEAGSSRKPNRQSRSRNTSYTQ